MKAVEAENGFLATKQRLRGPRIPLSSRGALKTLHNARRPALRLAYSTRRYETAITEKAALSKLVWRYLIIDEAQRIKTLPGACQDPF